MTSTEISIIILDDLLHLLDKNEDNLCEALPSEIEDKAKNELLKVGALMAFETMRSSINKLKGMALNAQSKSHGVAEA